MATHGGPRQGAGRPKGSRPKKSALRERAAAEAGMTPLEYMIKLYRDETLEPNLRLDAAKSAAPYIHPRLTSVQVSGDLNISHEQALKELA